MDSTSGLYLLEKHRIQIINKRVYSSVFHQPINVNGSPTENYKIFVD